MTELSVVVPVYNKLKYVEPCLESILEQDIESFEVIAVEGYTRAQALDVVNALMLMCTGREMYATRWLNSILISGFYMCLTVGLLPPGASVWRMQKGIT